MNAHQLYDRYAHPHLPKADPYATRLRDAFCANAEELVTWVVDAQSAILRGEGGHAPFPLSTVCDHVLAVAPEFPGSGLTVTVPCDRLATLVDAGDRSVFGRMMVDLVVLHLVRAADAVSVGIANLDIPQGGRIDVTSPARGKLTRALASRAADDVVERLGEGMADMDDAAFTAAAAWTRRTLH